MKRKGLWLFIGVLIGLGLGVLIGWGLWPVQYYDTTPMQLRADYRAEYLRLVAVSYQVDHDLAQARVRLTAMGDTPPFPRLVAHIETLIADGAPPFIVAPLIELAHDLGIETPVMRSFLEGAQP